MGLGLGGNVLGERPAHGLPRGGRRHGARRIPRPDGGGPDGLLPRLGGALLLAAAVLVRPDGWIYAGAVAAAGRIVAVSLHVLQGLWLAHWGLGPAIWVLCFAAVEVLRRRRPAAGAAVSWGVTAFAGLGSVLAVVEDAG